ncbi:unnamed protein product [Onchocerca ochengi]|uniref:ATP-dependent DNA helicase n=1 Tax=Onchocerca ochengi TaxID=42157 RepID=A0A182DWL3_ONCOC|nr:unnamed protein product [Onchocerca ochengi]
MNIDFTAGIYNESLIMIENLCLQIASKVPNQLEMPSPNRFAAASFDVELHHEENDNAINLLLILAAIRFQKDIALALTSSGTAATLLPSGSTAHSVLKLRLSIIETPRCNISKASGMEKTNTSADTNERNKCLSEVLYFVAIRKDIKINYNYACLAAKRSINWDIVTSIAGNWGRKGCRLI